MKVSVAICTYQGQSYLKEQLESICSQTRPVDEIIVCDDGSIDQSVQLCEEILKKTNIPYVIKVNETSLHVLRNFQQCYAMCSGDVIFSSDQDDIWEEHKVEEYLKCFEDPSIDMIAGNALLIDGQGKEMKLSLRDSIGFKAANEQMMLKELLRTFCITGATMAFRKSFGQKYLYCSKFWLHDGLLALAAACNFHLHYIDQPLTRYRLHGNNVCGVGDVDILATGTMQQLQQRKKKRLRKIALTCPYYFIDLTKEKMEMYQEVLDHIMKQGDIEEGSLALMKDCISFWKQRHQIASLTFRECRSMIRTFVQQDAYGSYCESRSFQYYDYYFWLIYHIKPRSKKQEGEAA